MYKKGDKVLYKNKLYKYDSVLSGVMHVIYDLRYNDIDFVYLKDLTPYVESNKYGKHYLERYEENA
jgi:hypothetical protein